VIQSQRNPRAPPLLRQGGLETRPYMEGPSPIVSNVNCPQFCPWL